jgi:MFS family permease
MTSAGIASRLRAFSLAAISVAICSPLVGKLFDRLDPRKLIAGFMTAFGLGIGSLAFLTPHLVQFYVTAIFIGIAGTGTYQLGHARIVAAWFERRLGTALSIVVAGSGVGSFFVPPLVQYLISAYGWRNAYLTLAALPLLAGVPLTLLFARLPAKTQTANRAPSPGVREAPGRPWRQAILTRGFLLLALESRSYYGKQVPQRPVPFAGSLYAGPAAQDFENATNLHFWHRMVNFYGQDQWKVTPAFTVTAGLRYDLDVFPSASDVRVIGAMNATNFGNVQPRVGLAYAPHGAKMVVRAGFGLFRGPWDYSDLMVGWQGASAFTSMNNPLVPDFNTANGVVGLGPSGVVDVSGPFLASQAFRNFATSGAYPSPDELQQFPLGYVQRKFPNDYSEQASLEVETQLGRGWLLTTEYQYLHAMDLPVYYSVNGLPNGTLPDGRQSFAPADPRFGFALIATPTGFSIYNAGIVSVRHSFAHHYSMLANYTYSKSIDIATDVQLTDTPQNYLDPAADRSVGDNDIRYRATISMMAESPANWTPLLRKFRVSMLNSLQSPRYYSILAGFNVLGDGFPFADRVGTSGRNSYRGAAYYDADMRLQRVFHLSERVSTTASVESFNLFNHRNVQSIDQVYGAPDFLGAVPRHFGDGIGSPANPTFATPNFTGPARQLQASARFNF